MSKQPLAHWDVRVDTFTISGNERRAQVYAHGLQPVTGRKKRVRQTILDTNMRETAWDELRPVLEAAGAKIEQTERER